MFVWAYVHMPNGVQSRTPGGFRGGVDVVKIQALSFKRLSPQAKSASQCPSAPPWNTAAVRAGDAMYLVHTTEWNRIHNDTRATAHRILKTQTV